MVTEKKSFIMKVLAITVLGIMVIALIQSLLIEVSPIVAADYQWGDKYVNGSGKYICACDDIEKKCIPCIDIIPE